MIDSAGIYYRIPIACINEPLAYNKNNQYEELKAKKIPNEQMLRVKFRLAASDIQMQLNNKHTVGAVKQQFIDTQKLQDVSVSNIRIFCMGKELKDDLFMYSYDIVDDVVM